MIKKLLWGITAVGISTIIMAVMMALNPNNQIVGISESSGQQYEEMTVLKRNHTYEQLLRRKSDGVVFSNTQTWMAATGDQASSIMMEEAHSSSLNNYIILKNKVFPAGKNGVPNVMDIAEPRKTEQPPNDKLLSRWRQWRNNAKPLNFKNLTALQ